MTPKRISTSRGLLFLLIVSGGACFAMRAAACDRYDLSNIQIQQPGIKVNMQIVQSGNVLTGSTIPDPIPHADQGAITGHWENGHIQLTVHWTAAPWRRCTPNWPFKDSCDWQPGVDMIGEYDGTVDSNGYARGQTWNFASPDKKSDWYTATSLQCMDPPFDLARIYTQSAALPGMEDNTDRQGSDYSTFELSQAKPELCQADCIEKRVTCRSWTYVRPGAQGNKYALCHLKSDKPLASTNTCCVSGVVANPALSAIQDSSASPGYANAAQPDQSKYITTRVMSESDDPSSPSNNADFYKYAPKTVLHKSADGPAMGEAGGFAGPAPAMTGTFDSDFGLLVLTKQDGTYSFKNGRVTITKIYGDFMDGTWSQSESGQKCSDGSYRGTLHFQFTKDGFKGNYGYCDGPANAGPWNGTRR